LHGCGQGARIPSGTVDVSESERERRLRELIDVQSTLGTSEEFGRLSLWAINLLSVTRARLADSQENLSGSVIACDKAERLLDEARAVIMLMRSEHDSLVAEHASALEDAATELARARTAIVVARTEMAGLEEELATAHRVGQETINRIGDDNDDETPPPEPAQGGEGDG
jgi:hypothetical protein